MAFGGGRLVEQLDDSNTIKLPTLAIQCKITDETTLSASAVRL
ncbi:hypothetical protein ACOBV8_21350 (plasmid) [Pseudoalteromonas espejiana]